MMPKENVVGNAGRRSWLRLLVGLILATGLLLSGSVVSADDPIPTPPPGKAPQWRLTTVRSLTVAQDVGGPSSDNPKLESSLNQLLDSHRREGLAEAHAFATTHMMVLDDNRVQVVIVTTQEAIGDLRKAVEALDGEYQGHYGTLLQASVPIDALELLAGLPDVQVIREPRRPVILAPMQVGSQTSEGVAASNATAWHAAGRTGSGVRVAVIDAGFADYGSLLGTDLPASITTYDWTSAGMGGSEHGSACAEVVYDMAYGATMDLHKISTDVELGNAVSQAIADGVDIISMSLGWTVDGPGDGTGSLANIVSNARSSGIFFAVAAGNEAEVGWSGTYNESGSGTHLWASGQDINYFGPGHSTSCYVIPAGYPIQVGLHWDDWTTVDQDYDLELHRWTGSAWSLVAGSYNRQADSYPTPEESVDVLAPASTCYGVVVRDYSTSRDGCLSLDAPQMGHLDEWVPARSLSFPADSPDAITVGAVDVSSYNLEPYSSQGPTFGSGGTCSGGTIKPDIAAYANVSTVSYGAGVFNGTSAATPHVAGAAALVKGVYPGYTVTQLQNYLENHSVDLGTPGKDNLYGAGRLNLGALPPTVTSITPNSGTNSGVIHITNLTGNGFQSGATVHLTKSGQLVITATNVTVATASHITCDFDLLGSAAGQWNVVVTNPDLQSGTLPNGFTVNGTPTGPTVTSITPSGGASTGTVHITNLAGSGFQDGATVKLARSGLADIHATNIVVLSPSLITCDFDLSGALAGQWNVVVTNPDSQSGQLTNGFTVKGGVHLPLVLRGWPPIPDTPWLNAISNPDGDGNYTVSWTSAAGAQSYRLEEATNAGFGGAAVVYQGAGTVYAVAGRPPGTYYYRVRANNTWGSSPWSNVKSTTVVPPSTIYASGDTMITQGYPTVNACDTIDMWAGYDDYLSPDGRIVRSLVQFDLSSVPPGTAINQARLFVNLYAYWDYPNRTRTITVYRVGSGWSECSVTWNTQPGMAESYGSQAVGQNLGSWYAFDVTNLVRGWVNGTFANFGLWLRGPEQSGSDSSWRAFLTSNSSSAPYLSISYGAGVAAEDVAGERAAPGSVAGPSAMDVLGEPDPADPCAGVWVSGRRCLEVAP